MPSSVTERCLPPVAPCRGSDGPVRWTDVTDTRSPITIVADRGAPPVAMGLAQRS